MPLSSRYVRTWANLEDMVQALESTNHNITISLDDPEIVWEDGRSDFDALYVLVWRHPGITVHYPT